MDAPTNEQLLDDDGCVSVFSVDQSGWRHGVTTRQVWHRPSDNTYWQAIYRVSTDGETNELRDGGARISQVKPVEKTVTDYVAV